MAELMLVNPRKRRAKRRAAPKTKALRTTRKRRARNPVARAHAAPRRVRRRRNPASGSMNIGSQLKHAFAGALGGVAVDFVAGMVVPKLPASMQGGYMGKVVKVGLAIGLGMIAQKSKMVKGPTAARLVEGALTVELYDLTRNVLQTAMPNVRLAGDDDYLGEFIPVGEYIPMNGTAEKLLSGEDAFAGDDFDLNGYEDDFAGIPGDVYPNPYDL